MLSKRTQSGRGTAALGLALLLGASASAADFADLKARGVIRVLAATDENPEWFSARASERPGFEREVLEGFARVHKLRFEVVGIERWEEAIPMLLQKKGDLLAGVNDTEARRKLIDLTAELLPARHVVVTSKPRRPVASEAELRTRSVAVIPETTAAEAVAKAGVGAAQVITVADVPEAIAALKTGRASAAVMDILDFLQARRKDPDLELGATLGAALSGAWGVRKTDPELRRALDTYLTELRRSAGWSRLLVKYFGNDAPAALGHSGPD
jgi:ABC-type amino acid transport substrate-binding protein